MKHLKRYNSLIFESVTGDIRDRFVELCEEELDMIEFELSMEGSVTLGDICDILKKEYSDFAQIEVDYMPTNKSNRRYFEVFLRAFQTSKDVEDGWPSHYKEFEVDRVDQDDREPPY